MIVLQSNYRYTPIFDLVCKKKLNWINKEIIGPGKKAKKKTYFLGIVSAFVVGKAEQKVAVAGFTDRLFATDSERDGELGAR